MKKNIVLSAALSACLLLTACGKTEETNPPEPTPPAVETPTPTPEESPTREFEIRAEFLTDAVEAAYGESLTLLQASGGEDAVKVLLLVTDTVTDLRLWELTVTDENGEAAIRETRCIDGPVIVSEESPAAVELVFEGLLPTTGISFTNPAGEMCHYSLELSGKVNEPILVDYTPAPDEYADYEAVIAAYSRAAAEEWDTGKAVENGLSELFADCVGNDPRATVGYWKTDLNGDGSEELLIGANSESVMNSCVLFDVFTTEAGHTLRVCQSSARNRWYWCGEGKIDNIYSNSAFQSGQHICIFENGRLVPQEGIEYDSTPEEQSPWMKLENGSRSSISDAEAESIRMEYDLLHEKMPLTSFEAAAMHSPS